MSDQHDSHKASNAAPVGEKLSASVEQLAALEQQATKDIAAALEEKNAKIGKARQKEQVILEEAALEAQERKAQVLKEAEAKALEQMRKIVADAEKEAEKTVEYGSKQASKASQELEKYFYGIVG